MYFQTLQGRLIAQVNGWVRNGELTERRLARMIGFSQPHTHNVLKGLRPLSPDMGDRILQKLNLSLLDLMQPEELYVWMRRARTQPVAQIRGARNGTHPGGAMPMPLSEARISPHMRDAVPLKRYDKTHNLAALNP